MKRYENHPIICPVGDRALVIEFGNEIKTEINDRVMQLNQKLITMKLDGMLETIPTFRSLLVMYDPMRISCRRLKKIIQSRCMEEEFKQDTLKSVFRIPVCYEGEYGIDLENVCRHTGLLPDEVIKLHGEKDYRIYMLGFLPGFPYLGGMNEQLFTPRLKNPRTRIPAGSVGIGGSQTGIYPLDSPGGWNLIGRTPLKLYDSSREEPVLYAAGDYIRFCQIGREEYAAIESEKEKWDVKAVI